MITNFKIFENKSMFFMFDEKMPLILSEINKNCIDKNGIFSVRKYSGEDIFFAVNDGIYRMNKKGEITAEIEY